MNGPHSSQMTCVLRLDTQTRGWDRSMHKLFKGIQDVTYTIDATRGLAYVSGKINPEIILRIRKARKHAQLIHMDYGYANPFYPPDANPPTVPPYPEIPPDNVPIHFNYYPELSPPLPPPPSPSPPHHMCYCYHPYNYPVAVPYYYHPYYGMEMPYSPLPQLPTRDAVTGEQQCRIL